jgi:two-component system, OmpR family, sensor kinase
MFVILQAVFWLTIIYNYQRAESLRAIDEQLNSWIMPLLPHFSPPGGPDFDGPGPGPGRGPPNRGPMPDFANSPFYYIVWSPDGDLVAKSPGAHAAPMPPHQNGPAGRLFRSRGIYRELALLTLDSSTVLVGTSMVPMNASLRKIGRQYALSGAAIVALMLAGGWLVMAGNVLRPIRQISATAKRIAGGDRGRRIDLDESETELGQLGAVLNETFDKLDKAFSQQVRFTADASHELRTPVSVILTQTQVALSRERSAEEYRQTLVTCERTAERMRALVNSLLQLARMDSGELHLTLEDCDLAKIAANALELVAPLAAQKGAVLRSSIESAPVRGESVKLGQVIVNLLQNAVQHNAPGTEISVTVQRGQDKAFVRVSDNGAGVPSDALPHLFDRFYRAEKSRSAGTGGTGLGLAISKAIIEAHGGTISVESKPGEGTVFMFVLPLAASFTSS